MNDFVVVDFWQNLHQIAQVVAVTHEHLQNVDSFAGELRGDPFVIDDDQKHI